MSAVASPIQEAHDLLQGRLSELEDEKGRIERAIAELPMNGNSPTRRRPGRPRGTTKTRSAKAPRKRARRGGTRAEEAVALVTKKPGISASDIAKAMKIKPNYLYRVMGELEKEGRVKKDGRTYFPAS